MEIKNDALKGKKRRKANLASFYQSQVVKVTGLAAASLGLFFSFVFLEKYVTKTVAVDQQIGALELVSPSWWLNGALKEKIYSAATANGEDLKLDEDAAESVRQNLEKAGGWLDDVKVQTTGKTFRIRAKWRKPLAVIKGGKKAFLLDSNLFVMDFLEVPALPIVSIVGAADEEDLLRAAGSPAPNKIEDIKAAVEILDRLDKRDSLERGGGLLYEIARIDVSNFNGRISPQNPHIVLYTTDDAQIIWGAQIGKWHRHLEVTDEQKIARLYSYFYEKGTLLGGAKVINLRDPQQTVPLPIDRYTVSEN